MHSLHPDPSPWGAVKAQGALLAVIVAFTLALLIPIVAPPAEPLPGWYPTVPAALGLVCLAMALEIADRIRRVRRGALPAVAVATWPWRAGQHDQVRVHHPETAGISSLELRLTATMVVAERKEFQAAEHGTHIYAETQHDAALLSVSGPALAAAATFTRAVDVQVPQAAADAGWTWSLQVRTRLANGHELVYGFPVTVADGGAPRVLHVDTTGQASRRLSG